MKNNNIQGVLLSIIIGLFVFFVGINVESDAAPNKIFKVYLNGVTVGLIESKDELENLIDEKQNEIKEKYNIKKVYPPSGLEIREEYTYSTDINTAEELYNLVEDKEPFTISGYKVTITYPEEAKETDVGSTRTGEPVKLNVLKKENFEEGFKNVIKAFVGTNEYELFATDSQLEIIDVGTKIETIYWEETITIKEDLINVNDFIFQNEEEVSKYLLFGTLEKQKHYQIKDGDDVKTISQIHNLNVEEFLVANPEIMSENVLLNPGQTVNVGLIDPMVTITAELHVVEDVVKRHKTEYIDDKNSYYGTQKVVQEGKDGIERLNEKILYRNGEIHELIVLPNEETISPVINEVISRGTKNYYGGYQYYNSQGNDAWSWPTLSPCVLTSRFGPRWGRNHNGIDISGTGYRSPIYAVNDGVVIVNEYQWDFGYYVVINHENGYLTLYSHLADAGRYPVGTRVKREQVIGLMGSTGVSTGTHLHFSVMKGSEFSYGNYLDPCASIFDC